MEDKYLRTEDSDVTRPSELVQGKLENTSLDIRVRGLEISFDFLKQKTETDYSVFIEKVNTSLEARKWILVAIIAIVSVFVATGTLIIGLINNSLDSYRNLESSYYSLLVENNKVFNEGKDTFLDLKDCLKSRDYWQYKECFK